MSAALALSHQHSLEALARLREDAIRATRAGDGACAYPVGDALPALWRDFVEGRVRLVDRFERDRHRYYVLRPTPVGPPAATLDGRERRLVEILGSGASEKFAAYTLGITPSAVSTIMKTSLLKLGLRSRMQLVVMMGDLRAATAA